MQYRIEENKEFKSKEVYFDGIPSQDIRDALKDMRFRWHRVKHCWYGYSDIETLETILKGNKKAPVKAKAKKAAGKKPEKKNKFGVKVGDFFSASWGYDQTQVDYFQVIALVGETSVRVREVNPPMIAEEATCPMAADRTYRLDRNVILPPSRYSVFINDQEKGDLKRLKSYREDGTCPQFYLSSFADAYYCAGETEKVYESWYR